MNGPERVESRDTAASCDLSRMADNSVANTYEIVVNRGEREEYEIENSGTCSENLRRKTYFPNFLE